MSVDQLAKLVGKLSIETPLSVEQLDLLPRKKKKIVCKILNHVVIITHSHDATTVRQRSIKAEPETSFDVPSTQRKAVIKVKPEPRDGSLQATRAVKSEVEPRLHQGPYLSLELAYEIKPTHAMLFPLMTGANQLDRATNQPINPSEVMRQYADLQEQPTEEITNGIHNVIKCYRGIVVKYYFGITNIKAPVKTIPGLHAGMLDRWNNLYGKNGFNIMICLHMVISHDTIEAYDGEPIRKKHKKRKEAAPIATPVTEAVSAQRKRERAIVVAIEKQLLDHYKGSDPKCKVEDNPPQKKKQEKKDIPPEGDVVNMVYMAVKYET